MVQLLSEYLRRKRLSAVKKHLKGDILDCGCGNAGIINFLRENQKYVGIELSKETVSKLRNNYSNALFFPKDLNADSLDGIPGKFDTVLFIAVIERLSKPEKAISETRRLLKSGGKVLITTPSPFANSLHRIGSSLGLFSKLAVEDHKKAYGYGEMKRLLESQGLKITSFHKFEFGLNQLFVAEPGTVKGGAL